MTKQEAIEGLRKGTLCLYIGNSTQEEVTNFLELVFPKAKNKMINFVSFYGLNYGLSHEWTSSQHPLSGTPFTLSDINKQKHVGYLSPIDLFGGIIPKGSVYSKGTNGYNPKYHSSYRLPPEIVETWEPYYEESEISFTFGADITIIVTREGIFYGDKPVDIKAIKEMHRKMTCDYKSGIDYATIKFRTVHIGCLELTEEDIRKVLNAYYKLTNQPLLI